MAQVTSLSLPNSGGSTFRANANNTLAALFSANSGPSAPSPTVGGMFWLDNGVSPPVLRMRNNANTAWDPITPMPGGTGYRQIAGGEILQWGINTLTAVGNFNSDTIGGQTFYTNYYTVNYPISFTSATSSGWVTLAAASFGTQGSMAGLNATLNLEGNGSPLTRFTVAVTTKTLGYLPTIHWGVIGR